MPSLLPTPPARHVPKRILATLRRTGPYNGYGLIGALDDGSDGVFDLPEGTVYPALHRLERDGFVTSSWSREAARRRRVYTLTGDGETAIAAKTNAWQRFAHGVSSVLEQQPAGRMA